MIAATATVAGARLATNNRADFLPFVSHGLTLIGTHELTMADFPGFGFGNDGAFPSSGLASSLCETDEPVSDAFPRPPEFFLKSCNKIARFHR
ncbi:MAG: hypothetical protein JJU00_19840 [Opitutales bacterium]|nr:hypothetical protein [Opitutales bacterium]